MSMPQKGDEITFESVGPGLGLRHVDNVIRKFELNRAEEAMTGAEARMTC